MLPLLTHVLYVCICYSSGSVKVILTCNDVAYCFTAVCRILYVYIYTYLVLRSCLTDRSTLPVTVSSRVILSCVELRSFVYMYAMID